MVIILVEVLHSSAVGSTPAHQAPRPMPPPPVGEIMFLLELTAGAETKNIVCACSEGQRIDTQPCKQKSTVRVALARAWKLLRTYFPRQIILFVARMTAPGVKYKGITQIYYKAATACPRAVTTHVGIISET